MSRYLYVCIFSLAFLCFSCEKDKETEPKLTRPEWLSTRVDELIQGNMCDISTVSVWEYRGKKYYEIYCQIWSCLGCHIFDEQGNRISGTTEGFATNDFLQYRKKLEEFKACD